MFLPGPYMLWWPTLRASHPLRTPEAEEPLNVQQTPTANVATMIYLKRTTAGAPTQPRRVPAAREQSPAAE